MLTGPTVILILKVAVAGVTVLLAASLIALARGYIKLHGQLNFWFMLLTLGAVLGLELLIRVVDPGMFAYFNAPTRTAFRVHLCFAVPSAILIPILYVTGKTYRDKLHYALALLFLVTWAGTAITGLFYLPHTAP